MAISRFKIHDDNNEDSVLFKKKVFKKSDMLHFPDHAWPSCRQLKKTDL